MNFNDSFNFLYFDIYSKKITFFYNNKEKISSYFGLFLTIIYILVSLILFIYYFIVTIERSQMKVYDSVIYSKEMPSLEVNSNLIYFAFLIENINTSFRFIDETIYYPKIYYIQRIKKNGEFYTLSKKEILYERCHEENFGEEYKKLFLEGELNTSYCLKEFNATLSGGQKYDRMSYIKIEILPCVNSSDNNFQCKPQEIINKYISGAYFSLIIKDIGFNPSNFSFPIFPGFQYLYTIVDKQIFKEYILYFRLTEIHSDKGLISENLHKEKYLRFQRESQNFYFRNESESERKEICILEIRLDDNIDIQKRTYTKISEVFSNIGGYMQLIYTIFSIISIIANNLGPEIKILNGIFNFNVQNNKIMMKIKSLKDFNIINSKTTLRFNSKPSKSLRKDIKLFKNMSRKSFGLSNNRLNKNDSLFPITVVNNKLDNSSQIIDIKKGKRNYTGVLKLSLSIDKRNRGKMSKRSSAQYRISLIDKDEDKEYTSPIKFNLFDYYCMRKLSSKKKEIDLFNIGSALYRKRMDIINVFTLLILTEKKLLNKEEKDLI